MAPPLSVLQRGEVLQYTKWAIIAFAIGFLCLFSFCTAIFLFMMRKQRTRRQAQLDVQSERRPFVTPLAQTDQSPSPKLPQYVRSPPPSYAYNEGIELQGTTNIAKIREQVQRQQLEGRQLPRRKPSNERELPKIPSTERELPKIPSSEPIELPSSFLTK